MENASEVFLQIYETDEWKGGSGEGSTVAATAPYRRILEHVLASPDVRSVTDVGCGDWQFSGLVDWQGKAYVGIDVVPELIERNARRAPPDRGSSARTPAPLRCRGPICS